MDRTELLQILRDATHELYQLGLSYSEILPIPPNLESSTIVDAEVLRFAVEPRVLDENAMKLQDSGHASSTDARAVFEPDAGPSVHVFGLLDGLEYLRFDCFEHKPHYHYIRHNPDGFTTVTFDRHADGDVIDWTLARLRSRLPEMLEYAGASRLAENARQHVTRISSAIDEVDKLLRAAR